MLKNIYISLSGAIAQNRQLEIISNNLANANTTSFKQQMAVFKMLKPSVNNFKNLNDIENSSSYTAFHQIVKDFSKGNPIKTNNKLDFMLDKGFFVVDSIEGQRFTKAGSMRIDNNRNLVLNTGEAVIGNNGPISISDKNFNIDINGNIYIDGSIIDKFKIVDFKNYNYLKKTGSNLYSNKLANELEIIKAPKIMQGYLESSNTNSVKNLTSMILTHRHIEAYQKAMKTYDDMMDKSSNTIGYIRN